MPQESRPSEVGADAEARDLASLVDTTHDRAERKRFPSLTPLECYRPGEVVEAQDLLSFAGEVEYIEIQSFIDHQKHLFSAICLQMMIFRVV